MKRILALCAALLWLGGANAIAANTAQVALSEAAYTDLGAAPVSVQALNGNVWVVVADSTPSLAAGGVLLTPLGPNLPITFNQADASSHVYALATSGPATVAYTYVYGGGGGGGGGAVTIASGAVASGAYASGSVASGAFASGSLAAGAGADGWSIPQGAKGDAACGTATGTCSELALLKYQNTQLASLVSGLLTPPIQMTLPTTPSLANGNGVVLVDSAGTNVATVKAASAAAAATDKSIVVQLNPAQPALTIPLTANTAQVNGVTTLTGAGATGTGAQRVTAAQDTSTIAGSAPGTAGTPSANVLTAQPPTSNLVSGTTSAMTGTTSTSLIAAVTSNRIYVTSISCVNSHATVGTFVTVQDGSGGTALATLAAAAVFGGDEKNGGGVPLFKTTSGNALYVADVTTGANVICNASGFSGP